MIGIIDYGMGNLRSVQKAFEYIGQNALIAGTPEELEPCDKIVLPGVGAFEDAINTIKNLGFDEAVFRAVEKGKYFLGICLGMQLIFDKSYENGEFKGLGLLGGEIVRLPEKVKIPQIGWNNLNVYKRSPLFEGLGEKPYVYFVHSYHLKTEEDIVSASTFYGEEIQVAVQHDNIFALQFHPEKSGDCGLKILRNFSALK